MFPNGRHCRPSSAQHRVVMRFLLSVFAFAATLASLEAAEPSRSVVSLSSADVSATWELITPQPAALESTCAPQPNSVLAISGQPTGYLQTKATFRNYRLRLEWRWTAKPGN